VTPLADLGRLQVAAVDLVRVRLPMVRPVRTALGAVAERDVLLVRVRGADAEVGWGECSAEAAPGYWHEHVDGCEEVLRRWLLPRLDGASVGAADVPAVGGWPMASAAVECAVLDALCRRAGVSMAAWLGGTRSHVDATLTVGVDDDAEPGPYRFVKLKVAPGSLPAELPAGVTVSADANGSLDPDAAASLAGLGLDHLEQPLAADDLVGHAVLRRLAPGLPVALDEPIRSAGDVRTAAALGAADIVVLKPGRLGGLRTARAAHDAAVAAGVRVKVGGMWDTGIGRAAALAVASLPGCSVAPDLSAADRYFARDVVAQPAVLDADGRLAVPTGPGLGVEVSLA
jgi:O-succinylbenzoate synthase